MNKVLKLIVLYMLAVMPMCVVSCSGGEEEEIPKTPIINPVNPDSDDTDDSKELLICATTSATKCIH